MTPPPPTSLQKVAISKLAIFHTNASTEISLLVVHNFYVLLIWFRFVFNNDQFYQYILDLQNKITSTLENLDGKAKFHEDLWDRPEGGGGSTDCSGQSAEYR